MSSRRTPTRRARRGYRFSSGSRSARGYTVVELLMALAVFGIGVVGVIAMQKVTSTSNRHAKNLATATHIAQSWLERLAVDATRWDQSHTLAATTTWLKAAQPLANATWQLPAADTVTELFGPGFGALGQPLPAPGSAGEIVFCTHLRLTYLIDPASQPGNGLIRAEVRVFWPRDGEPYANGADYCDAGANATNIGRAPESFHFVYKSTAIRQTSL
jgi:type IV pilus assembly protein PilV